MNKQQVKNVEAPESLEQNIRVAAGLGLLAAVGYAVTKL